MGEASLFEHVVPPNILSLYAIIFTYVCQGLNLTKSVHEEEKIQFSRFIRLRIFREGKKSMYDLDVMRYNKNRDAKCDAFKGENMKKFNKINRFYKRL